jgi:hypothetical protein
MKLSAFSYLPSASRRRRGFTGLILVAAAALLCLSCSQNEYKMEGPKPEAPKNARKAQPIQKEAGSGMNPMPPAPPQPAEPSK